MAFADIQSKITITGTGLADPAAFRTSVMADLKTLYETSAKGKKMIDDWLATAGHKIDIKYVPGVYQGFFFPATGTGTGRVEIDPEYIKGLSYIGDHGKAVLHTQLGALTHELGHALAGRSDNVNRDPANGKFMGQNVEFINPIWRELGIPIEIAYDAQSWDKGKGPLPGTADLHKSGYEYTNGAEIDGAFSSNRNLVATGGTRDLLIGGAGANTLQSGGGNDWLVGAGGDDELNGGDGTDTAVYFALNPADYDIRLNDDGATWTVIHQRGAKDEGKDVLKNVEKIQFGAQTFDLKKQGLTFQTDFALVIDTTGSMGSSIGSVKANANAIINALFDGGTTDARIGVVGFKDTTNGEPSSIILPFTNQASFEDRRAAAIAAINGITVSGGGDTPETAFDGLLKALNGTMGKWRPGAAVHRVALFTDAPAKDGALAAAVAAFAANIGATITSGASATGRSGSVDTFEVRLAGSTTAGGAGGNIALPDDGTEVPDFVPHDDPTKPLPGTAKLEIYTIFTGPAGTDVSNLEDIAEATGGSSFTAVTGDELVDKILEIIDLPAAGSIILGTRGNDTIDTAHSVPGQPVATAGRDLIYGFQGDDLLRGGAGDDLLRGDGGNDEQHGDEGKDVLRGGTGNDLLRGGAGDDRLLGEAGSDDMDGGEGSDTYYVSGADSIHDSGTSGNDRVIVTRSFTLSSSSGIESATLVDGVAGNLTGSELDNRLKGNASANVLKGMAGDDSLSGEGGTDTLIGGAGQDRMTGGAGADTFRLKSGDSLVASFDTITDFDTGVDKLDLDIVGAAGLKATRYTELTIATNNFEAALAAATAAMAGGKLKAAFVTGTSNSFLFWSTDNNKATIEEALVLKDRSGVGAFASTDLV